MYDSVRAKGGKFSNFADLEDVDKDQENFRTLTKLFGASDKDIIEKENLTAAELTKLIISIRRTAQQNAKIS